MKRVDKICEKIQLQEPICRTCRHFLMFTQPALLVRFGTLRGLCMEADEIPPGFVMATGSEQVEGLMLVEYDSFCKKYESIFHRFVERNYADRQPAAGKGRRGRQT